MLLKVGRPLSLVALLLVAVPGCDFLKEHQKAAIGTGVGALGGAGIGYAIKGKKGALVGGLVGALAGGAIGAYLDHRDKTAQQTNNAHNYQPTQGVRLELVGAGADPMAVAPGAQVTLQATYALMAPNPQGELQVTETRLLTLNGVKVAEVTDNVSRAPGTYTSNRPITLPPSAARGNYQYVVTVSASGQSSQLASNFAVN